jgi:enoyl-CoA hydratase
MSEMIGQREQDGITVLSLSHGRANAMDLEFCGAIAARFEALASGEGPVLLTGNGRIFSAGVDLKRILDGGPEYIRAFLPELERMVHAVFSCPRPVVAAIDGHAIAGGCVLACATDRRLMAMGQARIGVPELAVGVPFPPLVLEVMRAKLSPPSLHTLVYDAGTRSPDDASRLGLVDLVTDALEEEAMEWCQGVARIPAASFAATKEALNAPALRAADEQDLENCVRIWCSEPVLAAIERFVETTLGGR